MELSPAEKHAKEVDEERQRRAEELLRREEEKTRRGQDLVAREEEKVRREQELLQREEELEQDRQVGRELPPAGLLVSPLQCLHKHI